jgi:zinc transporter, ZIP family
MSSATQSPARSGNPRFPLWLSLLLPLAALAAVLFWLGGGLLSGLRTDVPPIESLTLGPVHVTRDGFELDVFNGGARTVTLAQVAVDDAYWQFHVHPSQIVPRFGHTRVHMYYPWVRAEPHTITILTSTGQTFSRTIPAATESPRLGLKTIGLYGLIGFLVGIVPVGLGMLWFPALRRFSRRWIDAVLVLTLGLLVFLLIDTLNEGLDSVHALPGVAQGTTLFIFAALLTWLVLLALSSSRARREPRPQTPGGWFLAVLIALSIGMHNLGEGLGIGAAFALGEAALGTFLVYGFTLHNITEGIGIVAPLLRPASSEGTEATRVSLASFIGLTVLAGGPAVIGAWIGGFAFSPLLGTVFLGVALGAIWQVIAEVGRMLIARSRSEGTPLVTWLNLGAFVTGLAVMYLTAFLVQA